MTLRDDIQVWLDEFAHAKEQEQPMDPALVLAAHLLKRAIARLAELEQGFRRL